jgi:ABC-type glycerol-3-phosphate transport system substrate-binding protein
MFMMKFRVVPFKRGVTAEQTLSSVICFVCCLALLAIAGCDSGPKRSPSEGSTSVLHDDLKGSELHVLVLNDPPLAAALKRWELEWNTLSGGKYVVAEATGKFPIDWANQYDIVIYPSELLGELVEEHWIMPIRTNLLNNEDFGPTDIFPLIWEHEIRWGNQPYALSLGAPVLEIAYRADLFAEHRLATPVTWEKYQELVDFFEDTDNWGSSAPAGEEGIDWQPAVEPLAPGWAARTFLARAAAYDRHRNQISTYFDSTNMEPLITTPPFERALKELVAASGPLSLQADPHDAYLALANGRCAMALTWPSAAAHLQKTETKKAADQKAALPGPQVKNIALEELPGSKDAFNLGRQTWEERSGEFESRVTYLGMAGRLGSVSSGTRNAPSANRLLAWITRSEVSQRICTASAATTLFRMSHVATTEPWLGTSLDHTVARQYTRTVESALSRSEYLLGLRIPEAEKYMAVLDEAVRRAADGKVEPAVALKQVAVAWESITDTIGREKQRLAYMHSLGESLESEPAQSTESTKED